MGCGFLAQLKSWTQSSIASIWFIQLPKIAGIGKALRIQHTGAALPRRCVKGKEDLPEPETPVKTIK